MEKLPRIAVIVDMVGGYGRQLLLGIARYASEHRPWLFFGDPERAVAPVGDRWRGDGIIAQVLDEPMRKELARFRRPLVNVSTRLHDLDLPSVLPNHDAAGELAAQHLLEKGFREFGYCGFAGHAYSEQRGESFVRAVEAAGGRCRGYASNPESMTQGKWAREEAALADWMRSLPKPVAVFCCNDVRARHLAHVCHEMGARIPEEVALLGADNDSLMCEFTTPPLSSIDVAVERIGYEAAALLDGLMAGAPAPDRPIRIEPRGVVARRSSDVLAISDADVAQALRFIRAQAMRPLTIDEVADATMVSRRALERRFRAVMGQSLGHTIALTRVDRAKDLLVHTPLRTSEIAERCGFQHVQHFNALFKRWAGCSMADYRRRHR